MTDGKFALRSIAQIIGKNNKRKKEVKTFTNKDETVLKKQMDVKGNLHIFKFYIS